MESERPNKEEPKGSNHNHSHAVMAQDRWMLDDSPQGLRLSIFNHLRYSLARDFLSATQREWWMATCQAISDRVIEKYIRTNAYHHECNSRRVYYLSLEYMMGRLFNENLNNLSIEDPVLDAFRELGLRYEELQEQEPDMGLGNGGLGRLAACFLDSLATLEFPSVGYGIRYEFGLFSQEIKDNKQVEHPDNWLKFGNPWQIERPEYAVNVKLYGHIETRFNEKGESVPEWVGTKTLVGIPWDVMIVGYNVQTVNFLRLWESAASNEFDFKVFNEGGYIDAVREKVMGETISKVLYPNDTTEIGKELRLVQQYFFVACSLKDIIRRFRRENSDWNHFADKVAVQLNDTHPAVAVVELMRILLDDEGLDWDHAWGICQKVFSYTNHTLLPEALECWSVALFQKVLPRHLQIIYEMNHQFLHDEVEVKWPGDVEKKRQLSIIDEGYGQKMIRMAHIAVIASHTVNGVAALHTELLKKKLFCDFNQLYPNKIINITNGISPRRWLHSCNPELSYLIDDKIGTEWVSQLERLQELEAWADDAEFHQRFMAIKHRNKENLAQVIAHSCGVTVNPHAIFDVQVKRIHEYKRQHLNLLHIITLYYQLLHNPSLDIHPRVFVFAGKAAPGYVLAKSMIQSISRVGEVINNDKRIQDKLKVVFIPNYSVTLASRIIPAADVSEQISTAGKEASGTGNMKLALNGALTIGTLDGANIEIRDAVGDDNIFIFGMRVEQVQHLLTEGYNPYHYYNSNEALRTILDWFVSDYFVDKDNHALIHLKQSLLDGGDRFMVLADYEAYCNKQKEVDLAYRDKASWARKAILNTARMGYFSSDRTIKEYAEKVWHLNPLPSTCILKR